MIPSHSLQTRFLALLPRIECHARIYFRDLKCPDKKSDRIAEVIAVAWKWFLSLERRGKDMAQFVTAVAKFASRSVRCGRRLAGMERAKDVLSARAQQRRGFAVNDLHDVGTLASIKDALHDNTKSTPSDAAAFRIDFPRWLRTLNERKRDLAHDLMSGEQTLVAARKFGISPGRVSQIRQELHDDWNRFHGAGTCESV